jgi:hypothetical protein
MQCQSRNSNRPSHIEEESRQCIKALKHADPNTACSGTSGGGELHSYSYTMYKRDGRRMCLRIQTDCLWLGTTQGMRYSIPTHGFIPTRKVVSEVTSGDSQSHGSGQRCVGSRAVELEDHFPNAP